MFEGIINSLLEKYLAPYLENMSSTNLRFRLGKMSAKNLKLKSHLCALLGFSELELQVGELKVLDIEVPFLALFSGDISIKVQNLEVHAIVQKSTSKSAKERLAELRQTRLDAVEHKAAQQIEVRKHQKVVEAAKQEGKDIDAGMVAKVARHFISNVKIEMSELSCRVSDPESGAHVAVDLGELFAQAPTEEEVLKATTTQTDVEVSRSTSNFDVDGARFTKAIGFNNFYVKGGYKVSSNMISLHRLQLVLLAGPGKMQAEIDFGLPEGRDGRPKPPDEVTLTGEQITACIMLSNALGEESKRLHALLMPPGAERMVNLHTKEGIKKADREYVALSTRYYRKELLEVVSHKRLQELEESEQWRLQVMRDVVPLPMQAEWFMPVMEELQEARKRDAKKEASWHNKMLQKCSCWSEDTMQKDPQRMMKELHEEAEGLKDVIVPNDFSLELQIGKLILELYDQEDQLLQVTLNTAGLVANVSQKVDHRGEQSADWDFSFVLQSFSIGINHQYDNMLRFGTANDKPAFRVNLDNRLEETKNVIAVSLSMQPLELFFHDSLIRSLRKLQTDIIRATKQEPSQEEIKPNAKMQDIVQQKKTEEEEEVLQSYYAMGKAWMETSAGKDMLEEAKKRTPDELELSVELQAPRIYFPVLGKAAVHISLGVLTAESKKPFTMESGELTVQLHPAEREPLLAVLTRQGVKHPMIASRPLITTLAFDDSCARVVVQLESMEIKASPDLIQILATIPKVLQEAMKIEEEVEVLEEEVEELQVVPKPKAKPAIQAPVEKAHEDSPSRRIYQFLLDVQNIGIMLDSDIDRSAPVLRVFAALRSVEVCQHGRQIHMPLETFALSAGGPCKQMMRVKADGFNLEVGRFEPLLETFELGCQLVKDDITGTEVHVFGRKPLLLNVNPVILRRLQWYSRRLAGSVVPMPDEPKPVPVRYALLNLSGVPVGLHLKLKDIAADAWMDVPPTGQTWRCLDNLDFTFPPSVGVAVAEPHVPASRRQIARLDLGLLNCIRIPNSQLIVQLRRPSVLGAVVLISSKVLIFNETSIPLALRFDGSKPLVWTSCASSDLLDGTADFYESQVRDGCTPGAVPSWLMPGGLASVPLDLPQPKDDDDDDDDEEDEDEGATSWEMMMQTEPNMWGKASFSFNSTYASVQCGSQHLLAVVDYETLAPPASEKLMNVKLLPPLQLTSCLPCKVEVQYHSLGEAVESSRQVEIAETDTVRIYDIGFPQTVRIRARVIGGEWSEWGTLELNEEDIGEEDRRLSRLEAEMQVDTPGFGEYTFALLDKGNGKVQLCCQTWLIDRTGWNLSVEREGPLIDAGDGVLLCGNNVKYHKISSNGRCGPEFSLPSGQNDWTITTTHEGTNVTVRARPLPGQQDHTTRCLEIVPRHIVQNLTEHPVEFRSGDCRVVVQPMDMESPKFTSENLQFRPSTASAWSVDIPAIEESAGTASIAVGRFCWTVDIRADHGTIYVSIKPGSKYALWNRLPKGECEIRVRSLQFRALAGEVVDFAWVDPFFKDKDLEAELILEEEDFTINPRTMYQKKLRGRLELFSSFENSTTFLEVREKQSYEQPIAAMTLNLVLPRIGVSLMGRSPHRVRISELLYLELALLQVVASTKLKQDMQVLNFALGDLQLDYQVPENPLQHCVVIGNRGVSSHTLARSFLQFHLERHQISSSEMHLACVSFKLDDMEVTVDDTLITTMLNVLDILVPAPTKTQAGFPLDSVQQVRKQAGASIVPTLDKIPAAEPIFQIDELMMSSISVKIWSRIRLKRVKSFLPSWACGLVGALSLSNSMSMDGAEISLSAKSLKNMHVKAADLASGFVREWMGNMLKSVASCLGHSSLLAIPKAPMELLESAGGYAAQFVPDADLDHMVDPDYAHHHKLQRQQPIRGASQGMHSAVSSFGQGLSGMMDIFRRPVEGAKQDGVKGFVKGVGTGLVSGVVKGVTGIKDAAMDFGRGLVAEAHRTFNPTQVVKKRVRHPRATFGPIGAIIDYSELDAHVIAYIHSKVDPRCAVEAVVPLFKWKDQKPQDQQDNDKVHESSDEDHPETAPMGPSFEALVVTKDEILLAEIPNQRLHEVKSFYPDLGYEMSGKNMVHSRILQHLRAVDRPAGSKSSFQIRHAIPFSSLISAKWAESKQEEKEQKPPLQLEIRAQQANGQFGHMSISQQRSLRPYTLDLPMPWGVCQELPQSLKSLLSSYDCGLPPKQVEILHLTLSTLRRAMQGDELENKTVVVEECWEVQRAAIAAGFESGWQLPFLPNEPEQQNGWVAEGLQRRHPLLDPNRNAARKKKGPPIRQLRFWKPNGTWQREINSDTDAEGWQYATGWSSRDWRAAPRIMLDVVRRRKWTLQYTLNFLGQMSSPSLPAPKLPVSMAPSLAPSVTESVPPSADVSAFPSAAASPTRTKRRPEQPESSASAKPGPISARQLHDIAAAAARRQWTTTRRLPLPRPSSIASPSSAQSPSFARPQSAASSSYRQSTQAVGQSHGGQLQSSLHVPRVGHAGHVQPTAATTAVVQTGSFPLTRVPQMRDPLLASFSSTTSRVSTATASRPQYRVVVNQR